MMERISKDEYYLRVAEAVLERSTCLRRKYGAVIVNNDEVVSTGYNGAPRRQVNCVDLGYCWRDANNIPHGERYEACKATHAELNAIISSSRKEMLGGTLYLVGHEAKTDERLEFSEPCSMCKRIIINAGIEEVVSWRNDKIHHQSVQNWITQDTLHFHTLPNENKDSLYHLEGDD